LIGALKGERSYHFGRKPEYRIIYYIDNDLITVTIIGTREGIYKRAKRRKK
jgi:mRNA-degrading endonuclease RelE of RelBE toxin-antitoxin system